MSDYEYAMERQLVARHELMVLRVRSLYGDDVPSAVEWGAALQAVRDTTLDTACAKMRELDSDGSSRRVT